jgi:hypothetical protein
MTTTRGENWLSVIKELQTNQTVNEHMADILVLARCQQDKTMCLEKISKNPGLALLMVDGFSELAFFHNLDCLPINVFRSECRLVALNGEGITADCYRIDPNSAFTDLEFTTPVWRDLKNIMTMDALEALQPPEQHASTYKGKQVLVVSPLVSITILETMSLSPSILILALSTKFQEYDRSSTTVKACTLLPPVLEFLWAAHHKKVPATVAGVDHSQEAKDWSAKLHLSCIVPAHIQDRPPAFVALPPIGLPPQDQGSLSSIAGDLRPIAVE